MRLHSQPKARPWRWLFFYACVALACELAVHLVWIRSCRALICYWGICPSSIWLMLLVTALAAPIPCWHLRHGLLKRTAGRDPPSARRFATIYFACGVAGVLTATVLFNLALNAWFQLQ